MRMFKSLSKKLSMILLLLISIMLVFTGCGVDDLEKELVEEPFIEEGESLEISKDGNYTSKEEVALYLDLYGELPANFISKKSARELGWESKKGNLWEVADGMSIGGDYFGNREGKLPKKDGRRYYECDINYDGGYRGEERIVYSNDGLIYYTGDHYNTFNLIYGDEG